MSINSTKIGPEDLAYAGVTVATSTLSFLGSLLIILTYSLYLDIRTTSRKLLVYLSFADLLTATGNIVGVAGFLYRASEQEDAVHDAWLCVFPAALTIFSTISSFSWTVCIAIFLYICIVHNRVVIAERITWSFHLVSWLLPGGITVVAAGNKVLGRGSVNESWCWIKATIGKEESIIWSFMTGPTWELLAVLLSLILYGLIKWHIRKEIKRESFLCHETYTVISHANRKMTFVPLIFILLRVWGLVRFLVTTYDEKNDNVFFMIMQGIGDSGQGLANMILFCLFTSKIRRHLLKSIKSSYHAIRAKLNCSHRGSGKPNVSPRPVPSTYYRGRIGGREGGNIEINASHYSEKSPLLADKPNT